MGNVSHAVPSIHPMIVVLGATGFPRTIEFAAEADSFAGEQAALDGARRTCMDGDRHRRRQPRIPRSVA
jgi:hypothetical protein